MPQIIIQRLLECGSDITTLGALKKALKLLGLKTDNIDRLYIELKNVVYRDDYKKISANDTVIFLPQCLRNKDCKAQLTHEGYQCKMCGRCKIAQIKKKLDPLGFRIFIVPGGSMVAKIIKKVHPKSILGIACINELLLALKHEKDLDIPMQGVELLKNGCVETDVDIDEVLDVASKT